MEAQRHLAIRARDGQRDIAVDQGTPLAVALSAMGAEVDGIRTVVLDSQGRRTDVAVPAGDLDDGELFALVDLTSRPTVISERDRQTDLSRTVPDGGARQESDAVGAGPVPRPAGWGVAALACAAVAIAGAWYLVAAGAGATRPGGLIAWLVLAVVAALTGAVMWAVPAQAARSVGGPLFVAFAGAAVAFAPGPFLGWPAAIGGGIMVGLTPLLLRVLPSTGLAVPTEQLVDLQANATSQWSVRGHLTGSPRPLRPRAIAALLKRATMRSDMGGVVLAVAAAVGGAIMLAGVPGGLVTRITGPIGAGFVAGALALRARVISSRLDKTVARLGAAAVLLELAWWLARTLGYGPLIAVPFMAVAAVAFIAALILRGGARSVAWSRVGDIIEAIMTATALPICLVGAGLLDTLRTVMS
ncbi:MAG: hypothetical protein LBM66_03990 [Bifidobacteriaceae bacterium]|nr:hypothetical protein [Bifidobacteriaceae bacterium]